MSNQIVGTVYQQIIDKVIQQSTTDFEEFGVEHATLAEMGQLWQEKLSALKIAALPWDPQPEPPRQPPTVPSNVNIKQEHDGASGPAGQDQLNFPNIKTERGYEPPVSAYPSMPNAGYTSGLDGNLAQQRANQLIAQRLGQTGNANMPMHNMAQHGGQGPIQGQQQRMSMPGQQPQHPRPQQAQQMQRPANVYASQTDGADEHLIEWKAMIEARSANHEEGNNERIAADRFMRAQVDALAARLDSGLMMPLDEMPKGRRRQAVIRVLQQQNFAKSLDERDHDHISPYDGNDDDEEEEARQSTDDEDAINSDLDDPEDDLDNNGEGDDDNIDYMLCTYDKVQRVKNKWKCTLKDGILTTGKKEYLFHKATGEFEW